MMRSASRQAQAALREHQGTVFGGQVSAATLTTLAAELYAIGNLLVSQPRLRRNLGDPATKPEGRVGLLEKLIKEQVAKQTLDIACFAVGMRWSSAWDLADAIESAGDDALFAAAEKDGSLSSVEDELFRFERILQGESGLAGVLDEFTADTARRTGLIDTLLEGKAASITIALLHHAVASQRKRSVGLAIDDLLEQAAARQERSVARVISAQPLTEQQQDRLAKALSQTYDRPISVRTALDPTLRGGVVVRVGDEVIDGSIATRITNARTLLAG
ncbi:MAG: F0F1 ATP synthase subunit delta [Jatrophihabitans sp.]